MVESYHDFVIWRCGCNNLKDRPNCSVGARVREREDEWTGLMRLAISGDSAAYHRLLKAVTPVLRAAARRGLARAGQPVDQSEDIVQDILLAVHLKRHTWDANAPFAPVAVCDRPQQADRCAAPPRPADFRQHRRFRRDHPERARRGDRAGKRGCGPAQIAAGTTARGAAVDRGRKRLDQGHRGEVRDERGRGARGAASRACRASPPNCGNNDHGNRSAHSNPRRRQRPPRPAGRVCAGAGVARRVAGFDGDILRGAGRSAGRHDRDA